MADKTAPKPNPEDDTYSDEETARRRDATVRAMIGMKPNPRKSPSRQPKPQQTNPRD